MNNVYLLVGFLICFSLFTCNSDIEQIDLKEQLIKSLIDDVRVSDIKKDGKITIVESRFCVDFNCRDYFKEYAERFQFYSLEDGFMRGLSKYILIESIEENGVIKIIIRNGNTKEEIEIQ